MAAASLHVCLVVSDGTVEGLQGKGCLFVALRANRDAPRSYCREKKQGITLGALGWGCCSEARGLVPPGLRLAEAPSPSHLVVHRITPLLVGAGLVPAGDQAEPSHLISK